MTAASTTRKQRRQVVLLRPVPGQTVIHDLWAGSKLLIVAGIGALLTFYPGWVPIGTVALLILAAARLAHIPRGVLPTVPRWLWLLLALGALTATFAGGSPVIGIGLADIRLGGPRHFLRITTASSPHLAILRSLATISSATPGSGPAFPSPNRIPTTSPGSGKDFWIATPISGWWSSTATPSPRCRKSGRTASASTPARSAIAI